MSVQQAMLERWTSYQPLLDLVPAERLYFGLVPATDDQQRPVRLPAVGLVLQGDLDYTETSSRSVLRQSAFSFQVMVQQASPGRPGSGLAEAETISRAILERFDRADFRYSRGTIQDMRPQGIRHEQPETGGFVLFSDWTVRSQERSR
jgi:hypothetical protein